MREYRSTDSVAPRGTADQDHAVRVVIIAIIAAASRARSGSRARICMPEHRVRTWAGHCKRHVHGLRILG